MLGDGSMVLEGAIVVHDITEPGLYGAPTRKVR